MLKWEEVDKKKTLVLKNGRNWRKEEKVEKLVARHIGEVCSNINNPRSRFSRHHNNTCHID